MCVHVVLNNIHTGNAVHNKSIPGLNSMHVLLKTNQEKIPKLSYANIVPNKL